MHIANPVWVLAQTILYGMMKARDKVNSLGLVRIPAHLLKGSEYDRSCIRQTCINMDKVLDFSILDLCLSAKMYFETRSRIEDSSVSCALMGLFS